MAIREEIRAFVSSTFYPPDDLGEDTSLLDTGTIDSTGVLELIAFLEERYGLEVGDRDVRPENFDSLRRIDAYVTRKLSGATRPDTGALLGRA